MFRSRSSTTHGLTLVETLVGIALLLAIVVGIFSAFQTLIELLAHNKAKVGALSLANERIEYIRSLEYKDVGTKGGIPPGILEETESTPLNNVDYVRETLVKYVDSDRDGTGSNDANNITTDYKKAKVEVGWRGKNGSSSVALITTIVPGGLESNVGGGTLVVKAIDAVGDAVGNADVHIKNSTTSPQIDITSATDVNGEVRYPGAPEACCYEVTVSKPGYSTSRTYDVTATNTNPDPGHLSVVEGNTTVQSFPIDLLSSTTIRTFYRRAEQTWEDPFNDMSKIADAASTTVSSGALHLTNTGSGYARDGYAFSETIAPSYLHKWEEVTFTKELLTGTDITVYVYAENPGGGLFRVPNSDLANNAQGFTNSPIDISGLSTSTYPRLALRVELETTDTSNTPFLNHWTLSYERGPVPFGGATFDMRGAKTVGTNASGTPLYKYDKTHTTPANGSLTLTDIEWDTYTATVDRSGFGFDISRSCAPQPMDIAPDSYVETELFFATSTANSLLVAVEGTTGMLSEDALVRLYRPSDGTDILQETGYCGQTFFEGLDSGTAANGDAYTLDASLDGTSTTTVNNVDVDGASAITVTAN